MSGLVMCALTACLDPILINELQVEENHPPELSEVTPEPGFAPLQVVVGENCLPETFAAQLSDLDDDVLTIRFNLVVQRTGSDNGARERVREEELAPAEERGPEGQQYNFQPLDLSFATLVSILDVDGLRNETNKPGQLLELRVSDNGFLAGQEVAGAGAGTAYFSWAIKLNFLEQGCDL
jgi:hypothetical protein